MDFETDKLLQHFFKKGDHIYICDNSYVHKTKERKNDNEFNALSKDFSDCPNLFGKYVTVIKDSYFLEVHFAGHTFLNEFIDIECDGEVYSVVATDKHSHYFNKKDLDEQEKFLQDMSMELDMQRPLKL